jgi:type II secretory ATPase GspE/PulE/Tfp pilus assembly ATPase PilB-like protein
MKTLAEAGYAPSQLKLWRAAARAGKGLVVISGVTGSGKSTSLKVFIETLPGLPVMAVYTVEDPIEYEIRGAHQIEVLRDLGSEDETRKRYARVMKALLRADLDACMVGEIRDALTANFVLQVAETGHMGLGTIHAHLISNIVPRLTNDQVGLSRQALTSPNIINLLVYQALVPLVCTHCADTPAVAAAADPEVAELLALMQTKFRVPTERLRFKHAGGCERCRGRGTKDMTVVAELWQPDRRWLQLVRENDDYGALLHYRSHSDGDFCSENMHGKTVFEHTLHKALNGLVDPRACEEFDTFERFEVLGVGVPAPRLRVVAEAP